MTITENWVHYNDDKIERDAVLYHRRLHIVCSTVGSGVDQRKHQSSASLALARGIYHWPMNSPHKRPVTRKLFPSDDVIMARSYLTPRDATATRESNTLVSRQNSLYFSVDIFKYVFSTHWGRDEIVAIFADDIFICIILNNYFHFIWNFIEKCSSGLIDNNYNMVRWISAPDTMGFGPRYDTFWYCGLFSLLQFCKHPPSKVRMKLRWVSTVKEVELWGYFQCFDNFIITLKSIIV